MNDTLKFEQLEDRTLLAVTVALSAKKGILTLTGDADGDIVAVEGTGNPGEVEVFVNGASQGTFVGVKTIRGGLGAGDDELRLAAINIGGSVDVNMGAGADELDVDCTPDESAAPDGAVFIGGSVTVNFGGNDGDVVDWDTDSGTFAIVIGNNLSLTAVADVDLDGDGGSPGVDPDDITVGGFLKIALNGFGDVNGDGNDIQIEDINVGGTTILNGSASADVIRIENSSFARRVEGSLGLGDDLLDIDEGAFNRFNAAVVVNFGAGFDTVDDNAGNFFAVPPIGKKGPEAII